MTAERPSNIPAATHRPGVLRSSEGDRELVVVVEDAGGDDLTVLVPWAPSGLSGNVKVVARERVTLVDATLGDVTAVLGHWGTGTQAMLGSSPDDGTSPPT